MRAREVACLGGLLLVVASLSGCATSGTGDDSALPPDSGTSQQHGQDSGVVDSSAQGLGDVGSAADSAVVDSGSTTLDSGSPATDSGSAAGDSGTLGDSASDSGGNGLDGGDGGHDAAADSSVVDSSVVDTAAPDTGTVVICQPGTLAGFTATPIAAVNNPGACTSGQVNSMVTQCLDPTSTQASCLAWQGVTANEDCLTNCPVFSTYSATNVTPGVSPPPAMGPWGPFIAVLNPGESDFFNLGACVTLADPTQQPCGDALTEQLECEYYACASNCSIPAPPADPTAAETAYNDCAIAADGCPASGNGPCTGVCGGYVNTVSSACGNVTGPALFCLDGSLSSTSSPTADPSLEKLIKQQCVN